MRPPYLTGETIYLRALVADDRDEPLAWHAGSFPINSARAGQLLEEMHDSPWEPETIQLAIARRADDQVIGSITVERHGGRTGTLAVHIAPTCPESNAIEAETLGIAVPWLRDEMELMVVTVRIAADQDVVIAAAESLGLDATARLREAIARPVGRIDLLVYQALNPRWAVEDDDA
jgi:RimJ/RimL family protein N-acetyltransferase